MSFEDEYIELEVIVTAATDKAILCQLEDGSEYWIPLSQIQDDDVEYHKEWEGYIYITQWIAEQKGLA